MIINEINRGNKCFLFDAEGEYEKLVRKNKGEYIVKKVLGQMRPAVVAMIASAGMGILLMGLFGTSVFAKIQFSSLRLIELCVFIVCFILLRCKKAGPIQIIFLSAVAGTILYCVL